VVHGESYCRSFNPGNKFKLVKHYNPAEQGKGYVITGVQHQARLGAEYVSGSTPTESIYHNSFTCIPDATVFRPERTTKKPRIHGVQTAVVTGPPGEEISCDKYGRVKVQFHWDRLGKKDDKSSCWIRCSQTNAGKNWGAMYIPRIGQEVVVTYLEGDPDRPLITGVVYNAEQTPSYDPSANKTKWGMKSNSSPGGVGFNEIRFEDKAGAEQILFQAQKDMDVRVGNTQRISVANDRHLTVHNNLKEKVLKNKDVQIDGKVQETIKDNVLRKIGGDEHQIVQGGRTESIEKDLNSTVTGDKNESVGKTWSLTADKDVQQKIGMNMALDAGMSVHIKAGMTLVLEAGMQLTLKAGASFIDISPAGIAISGVPLAMINSGGAAGSGAGCSATAAKPPKSRCLKSPTKRTTPQNQAKSRQSSIASDDPRPPHSGARVPCESSLKSSPGLSRAANSTWSATSGWRWAVRLVPTSVSAATAASRPSSSLWKPIFRSAGSAIWPVREARSSTARQSKWLCSTTATKSAPAPPDSSFTSKATCLALPRKWSPSSQRRAPSAAARRPRMKPWSAIRG
jgi:type VI secretion system secreted protein VgrG